MNIFGFGPPELVPMSAMTALPNLQESLGILVTLTFATFRDFKTN